MKVVETDRKRSIGFAMTTRELRQELRKILPTDDMFDLFLLDYFPDAYQSNSRGMSRYEKENRLLAAYDLDDVEAQIREFQKNPLFKYRANNAQPKWVVIWKKFTRLIYADAVLNILASVLDWIALKLGARREEAEPFKNLRIVFIIILLIVIFLALIRRCNGA